MERPYNPEGKHPHPNLEKRFRQLVEYARIPEAHERPARCRAIIFSPEGDNIVTIKRTKPGRTPYAVLPGGGLEEHDATPLDGIRRELQEELGIDQNGVVLRPEVIEMDGQFFYIGYLVNPDQAFNLHGPEGDRDPEVYGTYLTSWSSIDTLQAENTVPEELVEIISRG